MKGVKGFQKGHTINVGKPCSEKTKRKIGLANRKNPYIVVCPVCKKSRKVSKGIAYKIAQNKVSGVCRNCFVFKSNCGSFKKGQIPWNKGINPNRLESRRIYKLKWRENNRKKVNEYDRNYYKNHIEKRRLSVRVSSLKRRIKGHNGYFSVKILKTLQEKHTKNGNFICYICGKICNTFWEIDHIIPLSKNGTHHISNLAIACRSCNRKKSSKLI